MHVQMHACRASVSVPVYLLVTVTVYVSVHALCVWKYEHVFKLVHPMSTVCIHAYRHAGIHATG